MTKILNGIIISSILLIGFIPLSAFAAQPETPNGQPFNEIDAKIAELEVIIAQLRTDSEDNDEAFEDALAALDEKTTNKDMTLMDKDMQLMNEDTTLNNNLNRKIAILSAAMQQDDSVCDDIPEADKVADTTLGQLCDQADVWVANYEALCNNVPLFNDAIGIVDTSVIAVLGAANTALGGVNSAFNSLRNFEFNVNINPPGFNLNIPDINISIPIPAAPDPTINIPLPTININVPNFGANFGKLLSFLPASPIPSIPGNVIGIVDVKLDQVSDCSII